MNEAPEGLDYGSQHRDHESNVLESHLEKGKYDSARDGEHGSMLDKAAAMRLKDGGCCDPVYEHQRKNK
jgi:hypothetical protein